MIVLSFSRCECCVWRCVTFDILLLVCLCHPRNVRDGSPRRVIITLHMYTACTYHLSEPAAGRSVSIKSLYFFFFIFFTPSSPSSSSALAHINQQARVKVCCCTAQNCIRIYISTLLLLLPLPPLPLLLVLLLLLFIIFALSRGRNTLYVAFDCHSPRFRTVSLFRGYHNNNNASKSKSNNLKKKKYIYIYIYRRSERAAMWHTYTYGPKSQHKLCRNEKENVWRRRAYIARKREKELWLAVEERKEGICLECGAVVLY